jgi:hypothetical protein
MNPLNNLKVDNLKACFIIEEVTFAKPLLQNVRLAGTCPASPALCAGSLPTGRQEGAQYKMILHSREALACGRGAS